MMTGVEFIAQERLRQKEEEGYTAAHDAQFFSGELSQMAACYCKVAGVSFVKDAWPERMDLALCKRESYPHPSLKDLVRAGALIAAEIDRLVAEATAMTEAQG
ncbi:MAG: hypothetical protein AB9900_04930 [Humidesulfovibrio sp.]